MLRSHGIATFAQNKEFTDMKFSTFLFIAGLGVVAASCGKGTAETKETKSAVEFERITGSYAYTLVGSAADFDRDSDILCYDSATLILPTRVLDRDISALRDSILAAAFDTIAAPREGMQVYFERQATDMGYKIATDTVAGDDETRAEGLLLVDGKVVYLSGDWLTYCVTSSISQPGAAHGMTSNRYFNYAILPGKLVTLSTIFTKEGLAKLPELISRQAKRMQSVLGPTTIDGLPGNDNFVISPDGTILFAYQPYEVASYAQGEIRVPFYPYQLSDLMTPEGLQLFHLWAGE